MIWKDIRGYEGYYQVSNTGEVRRLTRTVIDKNGNQKKVLGRVLSKHIKDNDYLTVQLWKDNVGKKYYIHRLVAEAFIPNPDNLPTVNHKDYNKSNNDVNNLEWMSYKENNIYSVPRRKKSGNAKKVKCVETGDIYNSVCEASRITNISRTGISDCCNGYRNAHTAGGYHWEFIL